MSIKIVKANQQHITEVSRLFDLYRQFYQCDSDLPLATGFITARLTANESHIFVGLNEQKVCGFVQMYPSFCSVAANKIVILYDLFVDSENRRLGLGELLMHTAHDWARENGAYRVDLQTAHSNKIAQSLYKKLGYQNVLEDFHTYSLEL